jgi:hypothetical protein
MTKNAILAAAAAVVIGMGSLGAPAAFAMTGSKSMHHHHRHHACKAGGTVQHVKVHGKWTWICKVAHHHKGKAKSHSTGGSMKSTSSGKSHKAASKTY